MFHYHNFKGARRGLPVSPLVSDRTAAVMARREG
jgi:hypothetical protein